MTNHRSSIRFACAAIAAMLVALIASCSSVPAPAASCGEAVSPADLSGTAWLLTGYRYGDRSVALDRASMDAAGDGDAFSLSFDGGRVGGVASCNRYFGEAASGGPGGLSITGLASTKMACLDEPYGLSEYEFFAALSVATGWDLANGSLMLGGRAADGSSVELAFSSPGR